MKRRRNRNTETDSHSLRHSHNHTTNGKTRHSNKTTIPSPTLQTDAFWRSIPSQMVGFGVPGAVGVVGILVLLVASNSLKLRNVMTTIPSLLSSLSAWSQPIQTLPKSIQSSTPEKDLQRHRWGDFSGVAPIYSHRQYRIIQTFPHDPKAFCQGLQWDDRIKRLVESTGQYGESQVRIWDPFFDSSIPSSVVSPPTDPIQTHHDGPENHHSKQRQQQQTLLPNESRIRIEKSIDLDPAYFGEGLCWFQDEQGNDRYIQLTWQEQTAFVYEAATISATNTINTGSTTGSVTGSDQLTIIHSFRYTTSTNEGWGITFDPLQKVFYVSDGSDQIIVWNLQFQPIRTVRVTLRLDQHDHPQQQEPDRRRPLKFINELEWDPTDGTLLANVWFQNAVVRIHPITGYVLEVWDLSQLYPVRKREETADVLNGIAHYRDNQWFVTGKYWPHLYLLELHH